jgi:hypothetical protein
MRSDEQYSSAQGFGLDKETPEVFENWKVK